MACSLRRRCWQLPLVLILAGASAEAAPNDWAEGSADAEDGASRDYFNQGAELRWIQQLGDWHDRAGALHGDEAYASTTVEDTNTARFIEWDVTELVQAWTQGDFQNMGFFLRTLGGGGPIDFVSREGADSAQHPQLVVDGTPLDPVADTYLEPSTYRAQGAKEQLRVSDSNNALLRFDLSGLTAPTSAMLRLYTTDQYGTADIGVFHAAPGRQGPPPDLEAGLASAFQDDNGVVSHADVLLFEDYESDTWTDNWSDLGGEYDIADGDPAFGFDALAGRALRVLLPGGSNTALNTGFNFMEEIGSEPEEIYFRYYIRFGSDWVQTVDGGKLPGISGTYGVAGWGGRPSDGTNGWSARGSFKLTVPTGNNPLGGMQPIGNYVYHADMDGSYGDIYLWTENWGVEGYGGVLQNDAWYCLEQYVRMNTPGQNDGVLRAWVNGRKSLEKVDMRFRDVTDLKIERVWMNIYHGGTAASPYDQHVFIDNVVIARSYIGPMTGAPPPPPLDGGVATGDSGTASDGGVNPGVDGGVNPGVDGGVPAGGSFAGEDDSSGCACGMEPKKRIRTTIASLVAAWWRSQAD